MPTPGSSHNESALGRFYDREVLPRIEGDPNAIADVIGFELGWQEAKTGEWRATKVPPNNPWGVKKDASRIVFRPGKGHLGPFIHPNQKGGTWLQHAAGTNSDPTGEARADAIKALARPFGLSPPATSGVCVAEYPYSTVEGVEVRQLRYEDGKGEKRFCWQRSFDGSWKSGLAQLHPKLYCEDDIRQAIECGDVIDIFEGCKAAEAGRVLGLVATTSPHGQGLADHHLEALRGARQVRLHTDADLDGRDYVLEAGSQLAEVVKEVRVVELYPHREDGSDLADWVPERTVDRDEARILFSHLAQPFDQWADEYLRRRPVVGLSEDLDEVIRRPQGPQTMRRLAKEIRTVRTARGAQSGPFGDWVNLQLRENSPSIEVEILEAALAFEQVADGGDFGTEELRQFLMRSDPSRWRFFDDRGEVTMNRIGQVLNRLGAKSRDVRGLKKRRFSDVHRAADQHGIQVDSLRPCDPEKAQESQDLATLTHTKCPQTKDPCDPCDPGGLIGVTREEETLSRDISEERAGLEARPSEALEGLIDALDPESREDFDERAAILEFCGEMRRADAEADAYALVAGLSQDGGARLEARA